MEISFGIVSVSSIQIKILVGEIEIPKNTLKKEILRLLKSYKTLLMEQKFSVLYYTLYFCLLTEIRVPLVSG